MHVKNDDSKPQVWLEHQRSNVEPPKNYFNLTFLALLKNAAASLAGLEIGLGMTIKTFRLEEMINLLLPLEEEPRHSVKKILELNYGQRGYRGNFQEPIVAVTGTFTIPRAKRTRAIWSPKNDKAMWKSRSERYNRVEETIEWMRIFSEGGICLGKVYAYDSFGTWAAIGGEDEEIFPTTYQLSSAETRSLAHFLRNKSTPPAYLDLAIEYFQESYGLHSTASSFLGLMMALESIFGIDTELTYRIARNVAVLISDKMNPGDEVFSAVKALYKKRSQLIHGRRTEVTYDDVLRLREYLRRIIKRLLFSNVTQVELEHYLTATGFNSGTLLKGEHAYARRLRQTHQTSHQGP